MDSPAITSPAVAGSVPKVPRNFAPGCRPDGENTYISDLKVSLCLADEDATRALIGQALAATPRLSEDPTEHVNRAVALVHECLPRTGVELMLLTQMVSCHGHLMGQLAKAAQGKILGSSDGHLAMAMKLQRVFLAQVEALQRLRSTETPKMTFEHVHVSGGQAVIGGVVGVPSGASDAGSGWGAVS